MRATVATAKAIASQLHSPGSSSARTAATKTRPSTSTSKILGSWEAMITTAGRAAVNPVTTGSEST